ncbi:hypothetical protein evm_010728 [Chilo suppressalis]|nr:hypothetical protein evm_010728 [Chilo suppressalis]
MPCESCAVQFSVFKRKQVCYECERYYCSGCLRREGTSVLCTACKVLSTRPLLRNSIAHLKVRDLQCFLQRQNVSTRGCVEKEELVSLCVSHVNSAAFRRRGPRARPSPFSTLKGFTNNLNVFINNAFEIRNNAQPAPAPPQHSNCYNASHAHAPRPSAPQPQSQRPAPDPPRERFTTTPGGERDIVVPVPAPGSLTRTPSADGSGARVESADCFEIEDLDDSGWEFVARPADPLPDGNVARDTLFLCLENALRILQPLGEREEASLNTSIFPDALKETNIVPIFKKGDKYDIINYRPVSILNTFSKIFEKIICPILNTHCKTFLSESQHGFCPKKSTVTNLICYTNQLSKLIDSGGEVDSIYTDFSSAFDKVDHNILIQKLKRYGIHGPLLLWFKSYLKHRVLRVVINGYTSRSFTATSGVPQGSILGPVLFLIFVNDIPEIVKHSKCSIFADDLKLCRPIKSQDDVNLLQNDLDAIQEWCHSNKMVLNADKCFVIKFTKNKIIHTPTYSIDSKQLSQVKAICDLGVILDEKLTFVNHVDDIINKAWRMLGFLKRICRDFHNSTAILCLYSSLVRTVLEYASCVWNPQYKIHKERIERIQRQFTKFLAFKSPNCPYRANYENRLKHLKIDTLEKRRKCADILLLHKYLENNFRGLYSAKKCMEIAVCTLKNNSHRLVIPICFSFYVKICDIVIDADEPVTLDRLQSASQLELLSVRQLKQLLARNRVAYRGCLERSDLLHRARTLYADHAHYRAEVDNLPLEECCKICMAAPLECVLLECGHIAACTACSRQLAECPICRQYVVRAVSNIIITTIWRDHLANITHRKQIEHLLINFKMTNHRQPINVPTAGAQAFPMDGIGRLGHDPTRGPSPNWC